MHVDYPTCVSAMWVGLSEQFIQPDVAQIPFRHFVYIVKIKAVFGSTFVIIYKIIVID